MGARLRQGAPADERGQGDRGGALWLAGVIGVMICRSTSIGVRGSHRRDAGPRAAAAGEARGELLRPRLGVIRGNRAGALWRDRGRLGWRFPEGACTAHGPIAAQGLLQGATWGRLFKLPLSMGAVAPLRRPGAS
jgi:hypothetical protein